MLFRSLERVFRVVEQLVRCESIEDLLRGGLSSEPIGDVSQVAQPGREVPAENLRIQMVAVATVDRLDEVVEMVVADS